jgi:pimeloyl-ACP methyl ester carboxylesterase
MTDTLPCDQAEIHITPEHWVNLQDAYVRFRQEATTGALDTGRYLCPYYVWGKGPPLLFVHGLADDALSFLLPISLLSRHFRCIAYDLPTGQGDNARLTRYRHADLVDDVFTILDHFRIDRTFVFGSSFGSTITLAAMHRRPGRFERAVLQGGFAYRRLAPAEVLLCNLARYWPGPVRMLPLRERTLRNAHFAAFAPREPALWNFYMERASGHFMSTLARRALILHQVDLRKLLPEIPHPILMMCGDCDPLVGKECEDTLLKGLPNVTRVEFPGCGHLPYFTHPELLAEVTQRFLTPAACSMH